LVLLAELLDRIGGGLRLGRPKGRDLEPQLLLAPLRQNKVQPSWLDVDQTGAICQFAARSTFPTSLSQLQFHLRPRNASRLMRSTSAAFSDELRRPDDQRTLGRLGRLHLADQFEHLIGNGASFATIRHRLIPPE
jgi:hypothetical protein